ncbi:50S ribosomal protein L13 [Candidatus Omnitrophota bacterium]
MKKTYVAKEKDIKPKWYVVDASDKILGRLAAKVAVLLRGKHKPIFTPHIDTGDFVVVTNAARVRVTGRKLKEKVYKHYSGYQSGLKVRPLETMLKKKPVRVIYLAVKRMLPKNHLGKKVFSKLKVYAGEDHPHKAQNPQKLEV